MRIPRISISLAMASIAIAAADFAAIQAVYKLPTYNADHAIGVLLMPGLLLFGILVAARRLAGTGRSGSFLVGFEVFGWAAVYGYVLVWLTVSHLADSYLRHVFFPIYEVLRYNRLYGNLIDDSWNEGLRRLAIALTFATPQLLLALIGGRLSKWLGIELVVARRRKGAPRPDPATGAMISLNAEADPR